MWAFPGGNLPYGMQPGIPQHMMQAQYHMGIPQNPYAFHAMMGQGIGMGHETDSSEQQKQAAGGKAKRKKKMPEQGKPKKPATAFIMFSNQLREQVKSENPGISFTDIGRKLGEMWREMDPDVKKGYEDRATEAKDKYMAEKQKWLESKDGAGGSSTSAPGTGNAPAVAMWHLPNPQSTPSLASGADAATAATSNESVEAGRGSNFSTSEKSGAASGSVRAGASTAPEESHVAPSTANNREADDEKAAANHSHEQHAVFVDGGAKAKADADGKEGSPEEERQSHVGESEAEKIMVTEMEDQDNQQDVHTQESEVKKIDSAEAEKATGDIVREVDGHDVPN